MKSENGAWTLLFDFFFFFFWRWEVKLCDRKYIFKIVLLFLIAGKKKKSFLDYFLFILEENKYQLGANFLLIRA